MDPKKIAAQEAAKWVEPRTRIGLGAGSTIAYVVDFLADAIDRGLEIEIFTSSEQTAAVLQSKKIPVQDTGSAAHLHLYFDGCDQFDHQLNALKSGGGIHTSEKLLAAMADLFVLIGDASKYVPQLDTRFPVVVELLPESQAFVTRQLNQHYPEATVTLRRDEYRRPIATTRGNLLADISFKQLPELASINPLLKSIPGVVETSLFYGMARKAIIAGDDGVKILDRALR